MKAKVFVSYKHCDSESESLLSLLERKLFADIYSDRRLSFGEFRPNLLRWIDFCDFFVVLISEEGVKSLEVKGEVDHVRDRWRAADRKKPIIIPVRVNYSKPLKEFLGDLHENQILSWTGKDDNKEDKETLRKIRWAVAKAVIPWLSKAIAALLALSLLVYIFLFAPLRNIQKLRSASPATDSAAANVVPLSEAKTYRDHGSHFGWSSRADAAYAQYLARWSKGHLANARKSITQGKVPEGLLLAALVARENGGNVDPSFLKDYEEGHYRLLKQTLRTGFTLRAGLAVSSDGTQIATGDALWTPKTETKCSFGQEAVNAVAFGPRGLYTGGNEHVWLWTACRQGTQIRLTEEGEDLEDRVESLAIAPDDAVAFVMRKGRSVVLHEKSVSQALKHPEQVRSIAFSSDGSLITTSGETLNVWNRRESPPALRTIKTGPVLRASLRGDYVAVAGPRTVKVWLWRPAFKFKYEIRFVVPVHAVALSDEPGLLAVVTNGGVLLEQVSKDPFPLGRKPDAGKPTDAIDVVFSAGRKLIVKRIDAIEIWNSDPSPTSMDSPPNNPLDDWSGKFGLTVDENGHFKPVIFKEDR